MRLSIRAVLRLRWLLQSAAVRAPACSRRSSARAALAFGFATFAVASAALAGVVENKHREWRDPEFGHRLIRLKQWKAEAPQRPLVLAVGSSRVQQSIDPVSMQLPDGPTDPLVFNFGYRGGPPGMAVLNFFRILDGGIRPDFVCVEFSPLGIVQEFGGRAMLRKWSNRFTVGDVRWMINTGFLDPSASASIEFVTRWLASTATPCTSHRQVILPHWGPQWVTLYQQKMFGGERMDRFGYTEMLVPSTTTKLYREEPNLIWGPVAPLANMTEVAATTRLAFSLLLARCRAEGIPVAFVWVPLSGLVSGWIDPAARRACEEFASELIREWGTPVFPPPDWLVDDDFADGQHLIPLTAAKYSRWLAETHLKPWLVRNGGLSR